MQLSSNHSFDMLVPFNVGLHCNWLIVYIVDIVKNNAYETRLVDMTCPHDGSDESQERDSAQKLNDVPCRLIPAGADRKDRPSLVDEDI